MGYEVIVVGGGIGGLGCAALLAKEGMKVLILERSSFLGGRATSFKYNGYLLDVGMHVMSLGDVSPTEEMLRRVGVKVHYTWTEGLDFYTPEGWKDITQYRRGSKEDDSNLKAIIQEIVSMPKEAMDALDDTSMKEWLGDRTDRKAIQDLFRMIAWWYGITDTKDLAASEILYEMKRSLEKRHTLATGNQVVGGFKALIQPLKRAILKRGGEIRTDSEVSEVVIEKGEVKGILVNRKARIPEEIKGKIIPEVEFIPCPIVVCAIPMSYLFDVVPQGKLPNWFIEKVNKILNQQLGIYYGFAIGLHREISSSKKYYGTDRLLYHRIPEGMCLHAEYLSNFDPTHTPKGRQLFMTGYFGELGKLSRLEIKRSMDDLREILGEIFPEVIANADWFLPWIFPRWMTVLAKPGLVGKNRIDSKAPGIEGLFFAGEGYRGRLMGINPACDSAMICAERILSEQKKEIMGLETTEKWWK
jgi:hypothetical protein